MTVLEKLKSLFEGKRIRIDHTDWLVNPTCGVCRTVHQQHEIGEFDFEMDNGKRFGIYKPTISEKSVEGLIGHGLVGKRKIELI